MDSFKEFREINEGKNAISDIKSATRLMTRIKKLALKIQRSKDSSEQLRMIGIQNGYIACMLNMNAISSA